MWSWSLPITRSGGLSPLWTSTLLAARGIEVGQGRLEDHAARARHVVSVVGGFGFVLGHRVREVVVELLRRQPDRPVAGWPGCRSTGKMARIMAGGRRSTPLTGAGEIATPAAPSPRSSRSSVTRSTEGVADDHRRAIEPADDPLVVLDDLGEAEPVQGGRIAPHILDLPRHPRPGRRQHPAAPALTALLPPLPAPRRQPEAVDQDDWRRGNLGSHAVSSRVSRLRTTATLPAAEPPVSRGRVRRGAGRTASWPTPSGRPLETTSSSAGRDCCSSTKPAVSGTLRDLRLTAPWDEDRQRGPSFPPPVLRPSDAQRAVDGDHRRAAGVDGVDDLGVVDALRGRSR